MNYRILLVDRDARALRARGERFSEAGFRVSFTSDPGGLLARVAENEPDVLVFVTSKSDDWLVEAIGALRADGVRAPIVVLAEGANAPTPERFGCDAVLHRDVSPEVVAETIRGLPAPAATRPAESRTAAASREPGQMGESEELLTALERLGTIMAHRAAGRVVPNGPGGASPELAHLDETTDRDSPPRTVPRITEEGQDIADHLDAVFAQGLPALTTSTAPRDSGRSARSAPPAPVAVSRSRPAAPPEVETAPRAIATAAAPSATAPTPAPNAGRAPSTTAAAVQRRGQPVDPISLPELLEELATSSEAPGASRRRLGGWVLAAAAAVVLIAGGAMLVRGPFERDSAERTIAQGTGRSDLTEKIVAGPDRPSATRSPDRDLPTPVLDASAPPSEPAAAGRAAPEQVVDRAALAHQPEPVRVDPPTARPKAVVPTPKIVTRAETDRTASPPAAPKTAEPAPKTVARAESTRNPSPPPATPKTAEPAPKTVARAESTRDPSPSSATESAEATPAPARTTVAGPPELAEPPQASAPEVAPPETVATGSSVGAAPPEKLPADTGAAASEPVWTQPVVVERVAPTYSRKALKGVGRAMVVLKVLVDETGGISRVLVDQGLPDSELEAAAISAVLRWKFEPATENGRAVAAWTTARFVFER